METEGVIARSRRINRQKYRLRTDLMLRGPSIERAARERAQERGDRLRDFLFAPVELGGVSDGETIE